MRPSIPADSAQNPRSCTYGYGMRRLRRGHSLLSGVAAAILLALGLMLAVVQPAGAASYRDLKSVKYGRCLYAYGDPLEDIYLKPCSTTPAKYGNWTVTNAGYNNNHPLWIIKRQGGSCLGVLGNASNNYLYSSCSATNSRNVWEVFSVANGRLVLKSFGTFQSWRQHKCLTFNTGVLGSARLGACSLSNTATMIYK